MDMGCAMIYLLPNDFLTNLRALRTNYQNAKSITSLEKAKHPYKVSCFFGATNVKKRQQQISLIEKALTLLDDKLVEDNHFTSEDDLKNHVFALRVLVSLCFYIKSTTGEDYILRSEKNAKLVKLLDNIMKINQFNPIDEASHASAFYAAQEFIKMYSLEIKKGLLKDGIKDGEWYKFFGFVETEIKKIDNNLLQSFSATQITTKIRYPFGMAGYTIGYLGGDAIANSTSFIPIQTAALGGLLYVLAFTGPTTIGIGLVAPTIVSRSLRAYTGASCALILGTGMDAVGYGLGFGIGKVIDYSFILTYRALSLIASLCFNSSKQEKRSGFNLVNGQHIQDNVEVKIVELSEENAQDLKEGAKVEVNEAGLVINDKTLPWIVRHLTKEHLLPYIPELTKLLNNTSAEAGECHESPQVKAALG